MDSCNSGSLQSSSGGDEEYDSRAAESISALMSVNNAPLPSLAPSLFDPMSNYLQLQNPNPNMIWPRNDPFTRSDPNPNPFMSSFQPLLQVGMESNNSGDAPPLQNHATAAPTAARNPKKRSRASRRAPTTVLTTDTTNFRAMVQEFTGIPSPPFNSSSFSRNRLDLFRGVDSLHAPAYLRRPFAQKAQSPPSFLASVNSTTQTSNIFTAQNPLLDSLIQTNSKFSFSNPSILGSKPQNSFEPNNSSHIEMGRLSEFGLGHRNISNLVSSNQTAPQNDQNKDRIENNSDSSSNFHGEEGPENVAARGTEGMVESWICSSE